MPCENSMSFVRALMLCGFLLISVQSVSAQEAPADEFLRFIQTEGLRLRAADQAPKTAEEWQQRKAMVREKLAEAFGGFPTEKCPLEPRVLGTLERDGYRVEKIVFQTMPGIMMTALAYVPAQPGPRPAILQVHGHWKGAKQDPVVQSRCIGAAKHGFFVLAVDAFGAGERATGKALGEYHGEMSGATLFPSGLTLSGVQLYENMRAVDYIQSRPEVDPTKIGITGASGGGNQTMYAGAYDERFSAVVPVCSVGNYQSYLGAACCMCEVVPGAMRFAEERDILGLVAPRGLMVVNVTKDANQFSIREARKSLVGAQTVYDVLGRPDQLYHSTFRWHHDYHQPIREAMYGFMAQQLKGEGDGSPIAEIPFQTEEPEMLRCYPGESRPEHWVTLPRFAGAESRAVLAKWTAPTTAAEWDTRATQRATNLREKVFGGFPERSDVSAAIEQAKQPGPWTVRFSPEPNITVTMHHQPAEQPSTKTALLLNLEGSEAARKSPVAETLKKSGWNLVTVDLRATGIYSVKGDKIGRAPDHNSAEWAMWIGRPLLGQWTYDVLRVLDVLGDRKPVVIGDGPAGLVALSVSSLAGERTGGVVAMNSLASYVTNVPYENQRLGTLAPGILRDVGDVAHLAAIGRAPRTVIVGGVNGTGQSLDYLELITAYSPTVEKGRTVGEPNRFVVLEWSDSAGMLKALE